jgi:aspartate-semialdehyde dehydrogenase
MCAQVTWETKKIFGLGDDDIKVSCTAVRIPTFRAHSEAITIETAKPITPDAARALLAAAPGVRLVDEPSAARSVSPLSLRRRSSPVLTSPPSLPRPFFVACFGACASAGRYPMPLTATESFDVEVGRVRESLVFAPCGLDLFVCGDQLLRGAALNAVLIALKVLHP